MKKKAVRKPMPTYYKRRIKTLEIELASARATISAMTTASDKQKSIIKQLETEKDGWIRQLDDAKKNWMHWFKEAEKLSEEVSAIEEFRNSLKEFLK